LDLIFTPYINCLSAIKYSNNGGTWSVYAFQITVEGISNYFAWFDVDVWPSLGSYYDIWILRQKMHQIVYL
jgi:hypothetical protein